MVARVELDGGGGDAGLELGDGVVLAAGGDGDDELEPGAGLLFGGEDGGDPLAAELTLTVNFWPMVQWSVQMK